jgi:hypothetical protein
VFLTRREAYDTSFQKYLTHLGTIFTSGLVGKDAIPGEFIFAREDFPARFEEILSLITSRSFPKERSSLTHKQRSQLRDALDRRTSIPLDQHRRMGPSLVEPVNADQPFPVEDRLRLPEKIQGLAGLPKDQAFGRVEFPHADDPTPESSSFRA